MPAVAVRVGGDLEAEHVRLVDDRLHLFVGQLLRAARVALREDAAGRADLDHLGAVLVQLRTSWRAFVGAVVDPVAGWS